jgi:hypothetical protein
MANKLFTGSLKPVELNKANQSETAKITVTDKAATHERVTVPFSQEQKDLLDNLAKRLQRQRLSRDFVVTRNDIIRSLVDCLSLTIFDELHLRDKAELSSFIRRKLLS